MQGGRTSLTAPLATAQQTSQITKVMVCSDINAKNNPSYYLGRDGKETWSQGCTVMVSATALALSLSSLNIEERNVVLG